MVSSTDYKSEKGFLVSLEVNRRGHHIYLAGLDNMLRRIGFA